MECRRETDLGFGCSPDGSGVELIVGNIVLHIVTARFIECQHTAPIVFSR